MLRLVGELDRVDLNASSYVARVDLVLEPKESVVLVLETSASMAANEDLKWVQKAAHKLIRCGAHLFIYN